MPLEIAAGEGAEPEEQWEVHIFEAVQRFSDATILELRPAQVERLALELLDDVVLNSCLMKSLS